MSTACLREFLDCSRHFTAQNCGKAHLESCLSLEKWFRAGLLIVSFLVFGFLVGPNVQASLPGREPLSLVDHSRRVNIRPEFSKRNNIDSREAAKALLVIGLITGSNLAVD